MIKSYYRLALYLTTAIALTWLVLFLYLLSFSFEAANRAVIFVALPLAVLCGLWLGSNLARYVGAVWFLVSVGAVMWPLVMGDKIVFWPGVVWGVVLGALSLSAFWLLVLSKRFASEFAYQRETLPPWKRMLRRIALGVIIVAAVIATANDIYHLATL
jgi:hypothetical protein